ncbi:MAG TPA: anti-sigma factor [Candidatus Acidoferrales bacterium]|nr:anti-sigma factor [Candidatus Acidoferrales bacterium]
MSNPSPGMGMRQLGMPHLEDGHLLRYLDGELPQRKARQVRKHLEACWQCRAELEALETTVTDCVKYRKNVLGACLPAPPQPWKDLSREFDRIGEFEPLGEFEPIDGGLAGESLFGRLIRAAHLTNLSKPPAWRTPVKWAVCVALLAATAITFYQLRETASVQAAVLLKRAVVVSESRPRALRRVRITTPTRQITKVIGGGLRPSSGAALQTAAAGEAELAAMFREAKYNFDDPLSARSFTDWRDGLASKQDAVNTVPDRQRLGEVRAGDPSADALPAGELPTRELPVEQGAYEIKTTTDDGSLVAATLKLRMTDYEPLEGRFEFRNRDWVEMTELVDQQALPASTLAGTTGGTPRQPGVPPAFIANPAEANPPAGTDSGGMNLSGMHTELQVAEALHQAGADLGDPVEISREGQQLLVSGTGIPPKRQAQLHAVLDALPNVVVRFADPAFPASKPPVQSEPAPTRDAAGPENRQLQARIEERLGGRPQFERFSGQLLDWTDSAMARAYALRRLALEFPPAHERQMSAADRRVLHNLGREHLAEFARETARIETTLTPILMGLAAVPSKTQAKAEVKVEANTTVAWQTAADELLTAAHRVESLLAVALGVASSDKGGDRSPGHSADGSSDSAGDRIPAQLMSGLSQLTASIEQCQRHLSYDER